MSEQVIEAQQAQQAPEVPLIVKYQQQLAAFIQQRDQVKIQFEQLNGAIFACENMLKQYEDSAKKAGEDFANKVGVISDVKAIKKSRNLGGK